jgi:hypothetical protein
METMARVDDYIQARQIAAEEVATRSLEEVALSAGIPQIDSRTLRIRFLSRSYRIAWPDCGFEDIDAAGREVPIQEQVLILHYLLGASAAELSGRWIAYREIPGAAFYFSAFVKRAVDPLKKVFGSDGSAFKKAAGKLDGIDIGTGDAGFEFAVFPKVPLRLILWEGDEDFGPEANILFDAAAGRILSPEDAAWLAGMLVYRLMALARD